MASASRSNRRKSGLSGVGAIAAVLLLLWSLRVSAVESGSAVALQPPTMPALEFVNSVAITDNFQTLGRTDDAAFSLDDSGDQWTGTASFMVDAWQWRPPIVLAAQVPITVPATDMAEFRSLLRDASLAYSLPEPTPSAIPDNYHDHTISLLEAGSTVVRLQSRTSTFVRTRRSPYAVLLAEGTAFTTDDSVDEAMRKLHPYLSYETLDDLIRQAENPRLLTRTPEPKRHVLVPVAMLDRQ